MAITQISKIQLRRGESFDLPGAPTTANDPLTLAAGLDTGELGFTTNTGRLFIGHNSPTNGQTNYNRTIFPFRNVEVLTENSPLGSILQPTMSDNRHGFIRSEPMANTPVAAKFRVSDSLNAPQDFYVDLPGQGACAVMTYFIFDAAKNPLRLGRLSLLWNPTLVGEPLYNDEITHSVVDFGQIAWSAVVLGSLVDTHLYLQYINVTGGPVTAWFHIDRPAI